MVLDIPLAECGFFPTGIGGLFFNNPQRGGQRILQSSGQIHGFIEGKVIGDLADTTPYFALDNRGGIECAIDDDCQAMANNLPGHGSQCGRAKGVELEVNLMEERSSLYLTRLLSQLSYPQAALLIIAGGSLLLCR
jgi:hypothetical protein